MYKKSLLSVSIVLALTNTAQAQDTSQFKEVVVSATRTEQNITDVSASVESVSSKDIDRTLSKNLYDAVQYTPGVEATTDGRFGISGFNIRGMEGDRVKIVVDGVQQATPFNPGGGGVQAIYPNAVELDTLTSIEINKGPSSTLYGSDAMAGVVVLKTKDPSDVLKTDGDENRFGIKSSYYSADEQFKNTLTWAMRHGDLEALLIGTYATGGELKTYGDGEDISGTERGLENPADKELNNVLAKMYYRLNDTNKIGFVFERYNYQYDEDNQKGNYSLGGMLTYDDSQSNDETTRTRYGVNYEFTQANVAFDTMKLDLNYQTTETVNENYAFVSSGMAMFNYGNRTRVRSAEDQTIQFDGQFGKVIALDNSIHELTYGVNYVYTDFELDNVDIYHDTNTSKPGSTTIPDAKVNQWGIFLQDNAFLLEDTLVLNAGIRYDSFEADPSSDDGFTTDRKKNSNDAWTGKLGAVYHLNDKLSTFAQISQGFKAPTVEQLYYEYNTGAEFVPNPDLEAEKSLSYELGFRGQNDFAKFELTGFITQYKDFIDSEDLESSDPDKERITIVNRDEVDIKGVEFSSTLLLDESFSAPKGLYAKASVTFMESEDKTTGEALESVAPLSSVLGLGYDNQEHQFGALASVKLAAKKDNWASEDQIDSAGYGVMDITAYYAPLKDLTISAGLFNAFDKKYWTYQDVRGLDSTDNKDYYSQPGRNWGVSVDYQF
ncbi:TonB-dependent hemoglobin/transferrin/lactoferrin family receptor [Vibrio sp. B1FLJ16]|uniref:TonB-dependent hemoglobin/transferrin/lactoferrin family receptor n=1 Tax=Vibrio sp. B1FLJ16 TaxID=2751178 RepID=UPI0015F47517|nr:TonB-dependent hemoglobin/transferrin/lactoferrin family receptor [Vibrio sp. B1FLJ16]CAD7819533.1 COG1629 Outer membrane receptor proteins [Vibrio sp. B1FLJ16]CAE6939258.1 COG1629 Outer membrane receptor proteins [Vibrio sp. B1FLJ16]